MRRLQLYTQSTLSNPRTSATALSEFDRALKKHLQTLICMNIVHHCVYIVIMLICIWISTFVLTWLVFPDLETRAYIYLLTVLARDIYFKYDLFKK